MRFNHNSSSLLWGLITFLQPWARAWVHNSRQLISKLRSPEELQASWQPVKECCGWWNGEARTEDGLQHYRDRKAFPTFPHQRSQVWFNVSDRAGTCRRSGRDLMDSNFSSVESCGQLCAQRSPMQHPLFSERKRRGTFPLESKQSVHKDF